MLSRSKNTLVMAFVGILLVATIAGLTINYFKYQYRAVVASERERLAVSANCLDRYLNAKLTGLKLLATCPDLHSLDAEVVRRDLMAAVEVLNVANVAIYDLKGNLISDCWSAPGYARSAFEQICFNRTFQDVLLGQTGVSGRIECGDKDNIYISIQVPIINDGKVIAALVAYIPIGDISMPILYEQMSERQYISIWDGSGQFIYHPRLAEVYPENPALKEQMRSLLCDKTGIREFNSSLDGIDKLLIYTDLNNTNWRVAVTMPRNELSTKVLSKSLDDAKGFFLLALCLGLLYGVWYQAKRHEREREQLKLERMISVNQLAAGIAHEIRNPLTSIKGFIQLMARRANMPATPEHLEIIISEIGRIDSLISEFQMLARPVKEPVFKRVDICKLLHDVAWLMEGQFHNKNVGLQLQLPESGCFALGDISQLKQVFINLLKNALEAVSLDGKVIIAVGQQLGMMAVTVEDNGNGIHKEIIEKIGTPFFTTKETGTGLGLSVCYSIVQTHGGKIKVFSQVGKKTVFTVLLPQAEEIEYIPMDN